MQIIENKFFFFSPCTYEYAPSSVVFSQTNKFYLENMWKEAVSFWYLCL